MAAPDAAGDAGGAVAKRKSAFWSCLSCRVVSGSGLIGAGAWVYLQPYQLLRRRIQPGLWQITQMTFAIGLISWGIVVIADPVNSNK